MTILTIFPNNNGDTVGLNLFGAPYNYQAVQTNDSDTSYVGYPIAADLSHFIGIKTHGTTYWTDVADLTTSYVLNSKQYTTNPSTGLAWTWAEVDALQAGIKVESTFDLYHFDDSGLAGGVIASVTIKTYAKYVTSGKYGDFAYITQVYIEVDYTGPQYVLWRTDSSFPTYAGGKLEVSVDSGGSWAAVSPEEDAMLEDWGEP